MFLCRNCYFRIDEKMILTFLSTEATSDLLVGVQEAEPDSFYDDLGVHGEDVDVILSHPQFALHQVSCDLFKKKP